MQRSGGLWWFIVIALVGAIAWAGIAVLVDRKQAIVHSTPVQIGDGTYRSHVLATPESREKGLSGVKQIGKDEGRLFVFPERDKWAIWMKDMNFPIDIVWLDDEKRVVHLIRDAQPDSYPAERFIPKKTARYVLEVPAGSIDRSSIQLSTKATFDVGMAEVQ